MAWEKYQIDPSRPFNFMAAVTIHSDFGAQEKKICHCFHFFPICHQVDSKEIKPVHPKGNQPWIFIGRTDAEAEAPILWPPDVNNWLTGKDPDAGEDWRQEEKGTTEDEMVGWHHQLDGYEFEQALEFGDGQRSLEWCSLWGRKELDMTERLNWSIENSKHQ